MFGHEYFGLEMFADEYWGEQSAAAGGGDDADNRLWQDAGPQWTNFLR